MNINQLENLNYINFKNNNFSLKKNNQIETVTIRNQLDILKQKIDIANEKILFFSKTRNNFNINNNFLNKDELLTFDVLLDKDFELFDLIDDINFDEVILKLQILQQEKIDFWEMSGITIKDIKIVRNVDYHCGDSIEYFQLIGISAENEKKQNLRIELIELLEEIQSLDFSLFNLIESEKAKDSIIQKDIQKKKKEEEEYNQYIKLKKKYETT